MAQLLSALSSLYRADLAALVTFIAFIKFIDYLRSPLRKIPTIGYDGPLSYLSGIRWIKESRAMYQEGYDRYYGKVFKVAAPDRWQVVVSGKKMVDELRNAPDDVLGFAEAASELMQIKYTMGESIDLDPYHIPIIRGPITRNLSTVFPEVRDEVQAAFKDLIPPTSEWTSVPALSTMMKIIARASNRLFVGLPTCRNTDFLDLNTNFTIEVAISAQLINLFPKFLKPLAAKFLTNLEAQIQRGIRHLQPVIEERMQQLEAHGDNWADKPNDALQWMIDDVKGQETRDSVRELTLRVLVLNFAAIHTTSMTFTTTLYFLASHPELLPRLREELLSVTKEYGWTKLAMDKLILMDSFLKESQRLVGLGGLSMTRKALKDFSFSDGTCIPKGTFVSVASYATHHDEENYPSPNEFRGARFEDLRDPSNPGHSARHQMISPNTEFLLFGYGKHACPGRFFAVNELKMLVSHVILTYDVKHAKEGGYPAPQWFGGSQVPNRTAEVLFRARE